MLLPTVRAAHHATLLLSATLIACATGDAGDVIEPPPHAAREELRIGSVDDSATMLTYVRDLVVGPERRIYTLHPQESGIRVHDAEGRPIRTIGRAGEGPGEFRSPGNIGFLGDTLWVYDGRTFRFTLFDADGALIESRGFPVDLGEPGRNPPRPSGMLSDGTVRGSAPAWSQEVAAGTITHETEVRFDSSGAVTDTLIRFSVENRVWELHDPASPNGLRRYRDQPFGAAPLVTISEERPEIIIVERPIATNAERGEFRVTKLGLDGDTVFSEAFAYVPRPIPPELPDSLARAFSACPPSLPPRMAAGCPAPGRALELAREGLFAPAYFPPVSAMLPGRDGTIWLEREEAEGGESRWWILDERGRAVGSVALPAKVRVMAVERDRAWGMVTDELDVPYIVRYRVDR